MDIKFENSFIKSLYSTINSEKTYNCMACGQAIPRSRIVIGGRGYGKTMTILKCNIRKFCCSDECFMKYWSDLVSYMEGEL